MGMRPATRLRLERVLGAQLENAFVKSLRLCYHKTEVADRLIIALVYCPSIALVQGNGFGVVVDVIVQANLVGSTKLRQRVIQPVERLSAELHVLRVADMNSPVDRQVVVEVGAHTHVWILLTSKLADGSGCPQ